MSIYKILVVAPLVSKELLFNMVEKGINKISLKPLEDLNLKII